MNIKNCETTRRERAKKKKEYKNVPLVHILVSIQLLDHSHMHFHVVCDILDPLKCIRYRKL